MSRLPLFSTSQLQLHTSKNDCWVSLYNRKIYNVTPFLEEHPAGEELILEWAGKDITQIMSDPDSHEHSESAFEMLDEDMLVGYLATAEEQEELLSNKAHLVEVVPETIDLTEFGELPSEELLSVQTDYQHDLQKHRFIDLRRPMVLQVLLSDWTKEFYLDQIHRPRHYGKGSAPIFGGILEPLSLTPWWVVPVVWLPVDFYVFYLGWVNQSYAASLTFFAIGLFVWTLIEYVLHRFVFHLDKYLPDHPAAFALHFLLHGVHHYLPMDRMRLVMPPTLLVVLAYPFYKLVFSLLPYYYACSGFAGGFLGYIMYDTTHFMLHHAKLPKYMQDLKTYHLEHHYKNYELGFGVTSKFWDIIFGTVLNSDNVYEKKN
ncbi:unnamed protein product [Kuraishia capsulata CBS 1993]|uniref:Ceramide very long chain fatty acid hydroxylase n=1 Tax=Kuraishia capsulata CBS 1993 TaxID=1382522 RepID=W6MR60_9ASCO|nr:uncharacterized protein KUCA_T00003706001 [Kuraishia capsulata CBS 1993]CDK27727.1 unnamed protein product [Kuraishia capsulata CBS 1993]